jgi:SAM-dependent methyltransferase
VRGRHVHDDEQLQHTPALRRPRELVGRQAVNVRLHDHLLEIGCGTGQTTRHAALTAQAGSALGVDSSAPAIKRARELTRVQGLRNVTFEHADAQIHGIPAGALRPGDQQFATMFFDDPVAAFAHIGRALRATGCPVMMV